MSFTCDDLFLYQFVSNSTVVYAFVTLKPRHFQIDFLFWKLLYSLKFVQRHPINNKPALVQVMACYLTQWGRVTHICASKLIGSDNGLSLGRRQAIIWTSAGMLLIRHRGKKLQWNLIEIHPLSLQKIHLKMSSVKWRPFCLGLNVLTSDRMECIQSQPLGLTFNGNRTRKFLFFVLFVCSFCFVFFVFFFVYGMGVVVELNPRINFTHRSLRQYAILIFKVTNMCPFSSFLTPRFQRYDNKFTSMASSS